MDVFLGKKNFRRENLILNYLKNGSALMIGYWFALFKGAPIAEQVNIELGNNLKYQLYKSTKILVQPIKPCRWTRYQSWKNYMRWLKFYEFHKRYCEILQQKL